MFIDFHVHPNLPYLNADSWLKKWWTAIKSNGLDAVVITEHSYKNPERAFSEMVRSQPANSEVVVLPGVEVLTKEGIDVLAFSDSDRIYDYDELVMPMALDIDELLNFLVKKRDVFGVVAHPFTPGTTSIVAHKGEKYSLKAIDRLGAVEVHNGAMLGVIKMLEITGLHFLFQDKYSRALKTFELPKDFYPKNFSFTAGSDAHTPDSLGAGIRVPGSFKSINGFFKNPKKSVVLQKVCHPCKELFIPVSEWWIKKRI